MSDTTDNALDAGPDRIRIAVFRIVQEAVTNAIKHSGCSRISVDLTQSEDQILITVDNDGIEPTEGWRRSTGGVDNIRIRAALTRYLTYTLCAVLAALCGFFLAGFSGGAALNMGEQYLLMSIAVVVIGGTSVAGGFANPTGLWGAALFMFLLVSMLNTVGLSAGFRLIVTGAIIVGAIAISGRKTRP